MLALSRVERLSVRVREVLVGFAVCGVRSGSVPTSTGHLVDLFHQGTQDAELAVGVEVGLVVS